MRRLVYCTPFNHPPNLIAYHYKQNYTLIHKNAYKPTLICLDDCSTISGCRWKRQSFTMQTDFIPILSLFAFLEGEISSAQPLLSLSTIKVSLLPSSVSLSLFKAPIKSAILYHRSISISFGDNYRSIDFPSVHTIPSELHYFFVKKFINGREKSARHPLAVRWIRFHYTPPLERFNFLEVTISALSLPSTKPRKVRLESYLSSGSTLSSFANDQVHWLGQYTDGCFPLKMELAKC